MTERTSFMLAAVAVCFLVSARAEEPDDGLVLQQIFSTREAILKQSGATNGPGAPRFIAVWDFDGTILKGDCSEGLEEDGRIVYRGLPQLAIEHGLSALYPAVGGFERFWTDYTNMDARIGHWLAYPFIPQMLRGAKADDVLELSRRHFASTLSNYLFSSSVKIIHALQRGGVESYVVSASADIFVKGASDSVRIPGNRIYGIAVRIRDRRLTEELVYPVTWKEGKVAKIKELVAQFEREEPGRRVFVLAGFGDSYSTDGPFLKWIAGQSLPAGKPIAVFLNSKVEPEEYRGLFYQTRHEATVGGGTRIHQ